MEIPLINDSLYDGLGMATEMQKYRIRLLQQNLNRQCKMKDSSTVTKHKKIKSKVFSIQSPSSNLSSYHMIDFKGYPVSPPPISPSPLELPSSGRVSSVIRVKAPATTYVKEHHLIPTQVKRNPVVDLDSTSDEAYKLLFGNRKKHKRSESTFFNRQRHSNLPSPLE
jgi:hypothetical protein